MNPEIKAKWVAALHSGEYKQGTSPLIQRSRETEMTASEEDLEIYKRIAENYEQANTLLANWESGRYQVFGSSETYPQGGWNDNLGCCKTLDEAKEVLLDCLITGGLSWWHVVDTVTGKTVLES